MRVELIGGPLDGEIRDVPNDATALRIPMCEPYPMLSEVQAEYINLRVGIYHPAPSGAPMNLWYWQGETGR